MVNKACFVNFISTCLFFKIIRPLSKAVSIRSRHCLRFSFAITPLFEVRVRKQLGIVFCFAHDGKHVYLIFKLMIKNRAVFSLTWGIEAKRNQAFWKRFGYFLSFFSPFSKYNAKKTICCIYLLSQLNINREQKIIKI